LKAVREAHQVSLSQNQTGQYAADVIPQAFDSTKMIGMDVGVTKVIGVAHLQLR
jgi:hypothetical protein